MKQMLYIFVKYHHMYYKKYAVISLIKYVIQIVQVKYQNFLLLLKFH
ncbi:unnamed protein product [Schistosoma curassoni]|uniref:Uncharacterized protein n=1 Tax=Schistosoma curassoni TaxID=6186 RepID=A0A183KRC8_9TREM|nr:unnamed protein product [Schistosoma curassoni]